MPVSTPQNALTSNKLALFGGGGHACVVAELAQCMGLDLTGFFDDSSTGHLLNDVPLLGTYSAQLVSDSMLLLAIGSNVQRARLAALCAHAWCPALVHPRAWAAPSARLGAGTVVMAGACVQSAAQIGAHGIVNTNAVVEHHCTLGAFGHIGPGAVLCGGVQVGTGVLVGAGAVVAKGLRLGNWCTVGDGAVVRQHLPPGAVAVGNPARILRFEPLPGV